MYVYNICMYVGMYEYVYLCVWCMFHKKIAPGINCYVKQEFHFYLASITCSRDNMRQTTQESFRQMLLKV